MQANCLMEFPVQLLSSSSPKMEQLTNQVWQTIFPHMKGAD